MKRGDSHRKPTGTFFYSSTYFEVRSVIEMERTKAVGDASQQTRSLRGKMIKVEKLKTGKWIRHRLGSNPNLAVYFLLNWPSNTRC